MRWWVAASNRQLVVSTGPRNHDVRLPVTFCLKSFQMRSAGGNETGKIAIYVIEAIVDGTSVVGHDVVCEGTLGSSRSLQIGAAEMERDALDWRA